MKVGIDSYAYHRRFGEIRRYEADDGRRWTVWDFIDRSITLGVDGVSLETCFMPSLDEGFLRDLRARLDEASLERVLAWGHPHGLHMGTSPEAAEDLRCHFRSAEILGSSIMRIVVGSPRYRGVEPPKAQITRLVPIVRDLASEAAGRGLSLAIENHCDFTASELLDLLNRVGEKNLGVNLDTANLVRLGDDLLAAVTLLAPLALATHVKDLIIPEGSRGNPSAPWPCVPLGRGELDIRSVVAMLRDANYSGMLAVEMAEMHPSFPDEDTAVAESVAFLRELLGELPGGPPGVI